MLLTPDNPGFHLVNGTYTHLDRLDQATYDIADVALVLARTQRFMNHIPGLKYYVAEHCYHASYLYDYNRKGALMHDAAEWITGDIPTPIKRRLEGIKEIEEIIDRDLQRRFDYLPVDSFTFKVIDNVLFQVEHHYLYGTEEGPIFDIKNLELKFWDVEEACERFLARYDELSRNPV